MDSVYCDGATVQDVVFPSKMCRVCLLVDDDAKYVQLQHKYGMLQEVTNIKMEAADIARGWICLICAARISSIHKFCTSLREANVFLNTLNDQLKTCTDRNRAVISGLENLRTYNVAKKSFRISELSVCNILEYADNIKSESSLNEYHNADTKSTYDHDIVKIEIPKLVDLDPLSDSSSDDRLAVVTTHEQSYITKPSSPRIPRKRKISSSDELLLAEVVTPEESCFAKYPMHRFSTKKEFFSSDELAELTTYEESYNAESSTPRIPTKEALFPFEELAVVMTNEQSCITKRSRSRRNLKISNIKKEKFKNKERVLKRIKKVKAVNHEKRARKVILASLTKEKFWEDLKLKALDENFKSAKYKCTICVKTFAIESSYNSHMKRHNQNSGEYECVYCHLRFDTESGRQEHHSRHLRRYKCSQCEFTRRNKKAVEGHYADVHERPNVEDCQVCGKTFKTTYAKMTHTEIKCRKRKCDQCGKFIAPDYFQSHKNRHTKEKQFHCPKCSKKYATLKLLELHQNLYHSDSSESFYCAECNCFFKTKVMFEAHLKYTRKHVDKETLKSCPHCSARFSNKAAVVAHVNKIHLKTRPFECDKCTKKFFSMKTLQAHIKNVHEKIAVQRKYVCELCGLGFTETQILKSHMNTHTGAKPYKCSVCPCAFSHKSTLFNHNRLVHLKQKRKRRSKE